MEWTGWQVEPSASVSNHPNFANAECCRSKLKMRCWAVSKRRSVVGVALLDLVPTCYGILWDSMRFWMSLYGIGCMAMCMFIMFVSTMRNPVGLCICISEDRHSIASPRVSCKARNGDTSSLRSSNSGLCWRRLWPCFSGHVSTSFGFAKSLKSPKNWGFNAFDSHSHSGASGKSRENWTGALDQWSGIKFTDPMMLLHSILMFTSRCLVVFAYGIWPVQKFLPSILRQSQRLHWVQDDLGDPACQSFTRRDVSTEGMSFSP